MSTCLHRCTPDTNLVQTKIGAVETFAKLIFGKSKPFSVIYEPSYLGFSEEICRTFQPPPLTYHAYYAPHTPYTNLLGHHFGSSSGLAWFGRFGPVWVESAPRCCSILYGIVGLYCSVLSQIFFDFVWYCTSVLFSFVFRIVLFPPACPGAGCARACPDACVALPWMQ